MKKKSQLMRRYQHMIKHNQRFPLISFSSSSNHLNRTNIRIFIQFKVNEDAIQVKEGLSFNMFVYLLSLCLFSLQKSQVQRLAQINNECFSPFYFYHLLSQHFRLVFA